MTLYSKTVTLTVNLKPVLKDAIKQKLQMTMYIHPHSKRNDKNDLTSSNKLQLK